MSVWLPYPTAAAGGVLASVIPGPAAVLAGKARLP